MPEVARACWEMSPTEPAPDGKRSHSYACLRPLGHPGEHVAREADGTVLATWDPHPDEESELGVELRELQSRQFDEAEARQRDA